MRPRHTIATAATALLLLTGAVAPAAAAAPSDCPRSRVCLYDDAGWSGPVERIGCTRGFKSLNRYWTERATSVINRCSKPVTLRGYRLAERNTASSPGYTSSSTVVYAGQWANLGGSRRMDNRTSVVEVP